MQTVSGEGSAEVVAYSDGHQRISVVDVTAKNARMDRGQFKGFVSDVEKMFKAHKAGEGELG